VYKVSRIENKKVMIQYLAKKQQMGQSCNEKTLWHGTSLQLAHRIMKEGFTKNFAGDRGKHYIYKNYNLS